MSEKRERCGGKVGKPEWFEIRNHVPGRFGKGMLIGEKECPGCHDCDPAKWCEHDLQVCGEEDRVRAGDGSFCLCCRQDVGSGPHHTDGSPCVPALAEAKRMAIQALEQAEQERLPKCPTCGSKDGAPKMRAPIQDLELAPWHQGWHFKINECAIEGSCGVCQPCPTCSAKQPTLLARLLLDEAERRGEEAEKQEAKCPVHGAKACEGCSFPTKSVPSHCAHCRADEKAHFVFSDDASAHFICGCPQERGSGDAAEGQGGKGEVAQGGDRLSQAGIDPSPVKAVAAPDPSLSALAMEAARRIKNEALRFDPLMSGPRYAGFNMSAAIRIFKDAIAAAVKERDDRIAELEKLLAEKTNNAKS